MGDGAFGWVGALDESLLVAQCSPFQRAYIMMMVSDAAWQAAETLAAAHDLEGLLEETRNRGVQDLDLNTLINETLD